MFDRFGILNQFWLAWLAQADIGITAARKSDVLLREGTMRPGLRLVIGVQVVSLACGPTSPATPSSATPPGVVQPSVWGGDHAQLTVSDAGATIQFDCARGTLGTPLTVDQNGRFEQNGTLVPGHGGPVQANETPEQEPARYVGTIQNGTMTLTVTSAHLASTFTLELGQQGRLVRCL
jgi:hypothetical protein